MGRFRARLAAAWTAALLAALPPSWVAAQGAEADTWSGLYSGIHLGQGFADLTGIQDCCADDPGDDPDNLDPAGGLIGLQIGVNVQRDDLVYGGILDASVGAIRDSQFSLSETPPNESGLSVDGLASLRARVGLVRGDALIFATGGLGYVSADYWMRDPGAAIPFGRADLSGFGPVIGGGVEWRIREGTSVVLEALHFAVDTRADTSGLTSDSDPGDFVNLRDVTVLRLGLMVRL